MAASRPLPAPMFRGEKRTLPREAIRTRGTSRGEGTPLWDGPEQERAVRARAATPQLELPL